MSEETDKVAAEFFRLAADTLRDAKAVTAQEAPEIFRQVVDRALLENTLGGGLCLGIATLCGFLVVKSCRSARRDPYGGGDFGVILSSLAGLGFLAGASVLFIQAYVIHAAPKAYLLEVFLRGGR